MSYLFCLEAAGSRLLWRFPPRRLEAEAIRDCVLLVSGALDRRAGGPGFKVFEVQQETVHHYFPKTQWGPTEWRRMIYMTKIRQEQDPVFGIFDCPDGGQVMATRSRSTTPLQALNLLNSGFMLQQSEILAERIRTEAGDSPEAQVQRAFELMFGRTPDPIELQWSVDFIRQYSLPDMCRALLNANEFLQMIQGVERGEAAISRSMTGRLFKHVAEPAIPEERMLSERAAAQSTMPGLRVAKLDPERSSMTLLPRCAAPASR